VYLPLVPRALTPDSRSAFHSSRRSLNDELVRVDPLSDRRRSTRIRGVIDLASDRLTGVQNDGPIVSYSVYNTGTERSIRNR